jgi:hypothetical protein
MNQPHSKPFLQPIYLQLGHLDLLGAEPWALAQVVDPLAEAGGSSVLFGDTHGVTLQLLGKVGAKGLAFGQGD